MPYLDDFCDNTLAFLTRNIVYVIVTKETLGLVDVTVEPRDAATTIANIPVGAFGGAAEGGVYKLRKKTPNDARGLRVYFCGYERNKTIPLMLGNDANWMFTVTMTGCTFGVGSQAGADGAVRVAHANSATQAKPGVVIGPGGGVTGLDAQARMQAIYATSHVGPGGLLIEPDTYRGADEGIEVTTFGHHAPGGVWSFKALRYRKGGAIWTHGGVISYPIP